MGKEDEIERLNLFARVVPYSSIVGTAITVHDHAGRVVVTIALLNVISSKTNRKPRSMQLAHAIADAINAARVKSPADD